MTIKEKWRKVLAFISALLETPFESSYKPVPQCGIQRSKIKYTKQSTIATILMLDIHFLALLPNSPLLPPPNATTCSYELSWFPS